MTKKKHLKFLFTFLFSLFLAFLSAQTEKVEEKKPQRAVLITPSISTQFAGGDLSDRFGMSFTAGIGAGIKTSKNWIFSIDAQFMFGNDVRNVDQILASIYTQNENLLNQTGNNAQLSVFQRGFYGLGEVSKVFHQLGVNPNSGPSISVGAGFINHWIQFNNAGNDSPQIIEEYEKGYDRYSGGLLLKQSIGYMYLSPNRRINFKISFEVLQAFTTNYREFNYDTGMKDTDQHLDLLYGIRLNWYLPIYEKQIDEFYYD